MASKSRLTASGFGTRRKGSFASKTVDIGVVADAFLNNLVAPSGGIKKAGIPADTEAWQKTNWEIILGRRGNAVPVPAKKNLTFSASPTQAECEQLFAHVDEVRDSLEKIIRRFDS